MKEIWQETTDYVELIKIKEAMFVAFEGMLNELISSCGGLDAANSIVMTYGKAFDNCLPQAMQKIAELYQERFSQEEIIRLTEIQRDPAFMKLSAAHGQIESELNAFVSSVLQEEALKIQDEEHQRRVEEEDAERQRDLEKENE